MAFISICFHPIAIELSQKIDLSIFEYFNFFLRVFISRVWSTVVNIGSNINIVYEKDQTTSNKSNTKIELWNTTNDDISSEKLTL